MKFAGLEIHVSFSKKLTEEEQDVLFKNFIHLIEGKKLYFGGGLSEDYLKGFIDMSDSLDNIEDIECFLKNYINDKPSIVKNYKLTPVEIAR